jgi:signal peptidase I
LFLLGLICPGAPFHLRGRTGIGGFLNILLVSFWLVFILVWSVVKFAPVVPLIAAGSAWLLIVAMVAFDGARLTEREEERLQERTGALSSLIALILTTWAGPLLALFILTTSVFWTLHRVQDESMYPTLLPGDLVLIDRRAYDLQGPSPGDVIAYRRDGTLRFGRIIAGPGESVSRLDGAWFVDGSRHAQTPVGSDNATQFKERAGTMPSSVDARWESNGQRTYLVAGQPAETGTLADEPEEWKVSEENLFVLNDNRSVTSDSRTESGLDFEDIEGMVLYIVESGVDVASVSRARTGRQVQRPNRLLQRSARR